MLENVIKCKWSNINQCTYLTSSKLSLMSSHGSYGLWSAYLAGGDVVVADGYSGHQGGNSIENIWLEFWFEKRLEITF